MRNEEMETTSTSTILDNLTLKRGKRWGSSCRPKDQREVFFEDGRWLIYVNILIEKMENEREREKAGRGSGCWEREGRSQLKKGKKKVRVTW